ncbi:CU044_5270 family protein [Streptomyces sp. R41]|uniref:CU044_5270 family protein n=1 Tax=Streptomyces sp. R41 TaxID=3238632 RepID=A0AB39RML8_9ACTN
MNTLPEKDLPPGRHRLLKEHLMTEIRQASQVPRRDETPARVRSKWLRPAIAAVAVAAVAATVVVAMPASDGKSGPGAAPGASKQVSKDVSKDVPKDAATLLGDIALAAEHQKVPGNIRDDQFVYIESRVGYSVYENNKPARVEPIHEREIWLSVDGDHWGLLKEDNHIGTTKLEPDPLHTPSDTDYRNLQTLPTDPDKMLDWLHKNGNGGTSENQQAFALVGDLVSESLLPPDVGAALFRAAAKIPGVVVVPDAVDAAGRHGVAVARVDGGEREELIFDRETKKYLGERVVAVEDLPSGFKKGQTTGSSAILKREVVDKAGQRP